MAQESNMAKILRSQFDSEKGRWRVQKARELKPIADDLGCTMAQMALAWCAANKRVTTVITGASRPEQVGENMRVRVVFFSLLLCIVSDCLFLVGARSGTPSHARGYGTYRQGAGQQAGGRSAALQAHLSGSRLFAVVCMYVVNLCVL